MSVELSRMLEGLSMEDRKKKEREIRQRQQEEFNQQRDSYKKQREEKEEKERLNTLKKIGVTPIKSPVVENRPKPDPKAYGRERLGVRTNMFKINVKKQMKIFKYKLEITGKRNDDALNVEFTNSTPSEFYEVERRRVCTRLFNELIRLHSDKLVLRTQLYYDQRSIIYSVKDLKIEEGESLVLTFKREEAFPDQHDAIDLTAELRGCTDFKCTITFEGETLSNSLAEDLTDNNLNMDYQVASFVDVATLQELVSQPDDFIMFPKSTAYYVNPVQHGAANDIQQFSGGVYIAVGLQKTSRVIGDYNQSLSIVVSPKYSLFHAVELLSDKLQSFNSDNFELNNKIIKGVYIMPLHLLQREHNPRMVVAQVVRLGDSASDTKFDQDGTLVSVVDYFALQHGIEVIPDNPVVVCRQGRRTVFYPLELCVVCDNVRLNTANASVGNFIAELIKRAALKPDVLRQRVQDAFEALQLVGSEFMTNAGLEVSSSPIDVEAPVLTAPEMRYGNNCSARFDTASSGWRTSRLQYALGAPSVKWVCYAAVRGVPFTEHQLNTFGRSYLEMCGEKGLQLGNLALVDVLEVRYGHSSDVPALHKALKKAKEKGDCEFALVITNENDTLIHGLLKGYEQIYGIITQNVTSKVALSASGQSGPVKRLTMENIINKTNMKLGGLNYRLAVNKREELGRDDLFIGFGLNHVAGGLGALNDEKGDEVEKEPLAPSVLGYAANDLSEPIAFTGDFIFHQALRHGHLDSFLQAALTVFDRYLANRGKVPKRVFIFRQGSSKGELNNILSYEVPLFRGAIDQKFGSGTKLVLLVANKMHNLRFTPVNIDPNAKNKNVTPGMVVNKEIVDPLYTEFYLASTKALQGSTKVPKYMILCNDAGMNLPEIEKITFELCFGHQVVSMPTSLPSPLYVALEYAKRGRNLYNTGQHFGMPADLDYLNENLTLSYPEVRDKRVNA